MLGAVDRQRQMRTMLLRRPEWRPVRAVAVSYPIVLAVVFMTGGRLVR